jgi:mannose-6-phosphate isomerase-like protein (cupin superfamily)
MNLRRPALLLALAVAAAGPVHAQTQAPAALPFFSAADVAALVAKAEREHKPGEPLLIQPLVRLAPYGANLEYRTAVAPAAVHEKDAELFYVLEGSGVVVTGGRLVAGTRSDADNIFGTGIEGGTSRRVAKGDLFFVPQNTPHWFSAVDGRLVLMSLHVPRS